jgi:hypothetical protein
MPFYHNLLTPDYDEVMKIRFTAPMGWCAKCFVVFSSMPILQFIVGIRLHVVPQKAQIVYHYLSNCIPSLRFISCETDIREMQAKRWADGNELRASLQHRAHNQCINPDLHPYTVL